MRVIIYKQTRRQGYDIQTDHKAGLFHTDRQGGGVIPYRQTRRQGYYRQTDKEVGFTGSRRQV